MNTGNPTTESDVASGRTVWIVCVALALLIAGSFVVMAVLPSSEDAARQACLERGWSVEQIQHVGFERHLPPLNQSAREDFLVVASNPLERLRVSLQRPAHFLPWRVLDVERVDEATIRGK